MSPDPEQTQGPSGDDSRGDGDETLDEIILAYLSAGVEARGDRAAWIRKHPGHAAALADFFEGEGLIPAADGWDSPGDTLAFGRVPDPVAINQMFGPYAILGVLGRGGMGVVYRAWQASLGRFIAIKMLGGSFRPGSSEARRFRAEADAIAGLDDPGIVKIHDVGEVDGRAYFTMELIVGGSLDRQLGRFRGDSRAGAALVADAARAVHHAHLRGILHRDLKPSNLLLGGGDRPIVSDFGLARRIEGDSDLTETGAILGSPRYMAPESIDARPSSITTAVDVYGLGAILYAVLTGEPPFGGKNPAETLAMVRDEAPRPPRSVNPSVPRDLETICLKCLAKAPGDRYASAEALAEDLGRWSSGEAILGRRVGPAAKLVGWARRKPALAALALALGVATALGLGGVLWQWREAVAAREALERSLYASLITLADRELNAGEVALARTLLDRCPPARRGWEWHYLRNGRRIASTGPVEDRAAVFDLAYSPDGRKVALPGDRQGDGRDPDGRPGGEPRRLEPAGPPGVGGQDRPRPDRQAGRLGQLLGRGRRLRLGDRHARLDVLAEADRGLLEPRLLARRPGPRRRPAGRDRPARRRHRRPARQARRPQGPGLRPELPPRRSPARLGRRRRLGDRLGPRLADGPAHDPRGEPTADQGALLQPRRGPARRRDRRRHRRHLGRRDRPGAGQEPRPRRQGQADHLRPDRPPLRLGGGRRPDQDLGRRARRRAPGDPRFRPAPRRARLQPRRPRALLGRADPPHPRRPAAREPPAGPGRLPRRPRCAGDRPGLRPGRLADGDGLARPDHPDPRRPDRPRPRPADRPRGGPGMPGVRPRRPRARLGRVGPIRPGLGPPDRPGRG